MLGPPFTRARTHADLAALHWGLLSVTGAGEPNMNNHARCQTEQIIFMLINLATQFVWAQVIATFTSLMLTSNPGTIDFRKSMDELNRTPQIRSARFQKSHPPVQQPYSPANILLFCSMCRVASLRFVT